jgi:hypothetical protein
MIHYTNEEYGFDGTAEDIDEYFTRENFEAMFGADDTIDAMTDDDFAELRRQAHADLD